jgi:outer membrane scaffolding protein for murein synthesis (MipA/OmpV family)
MKVKNIIIVALLAILPSMIFAQTRPDATTIERNNQPPATVANGGGDNAKVDASDAGAQRPIFLKTENVTGFAGFDSKYLYRNNPFSAGNKLAYLETAMWLNTAYAGASFNAIEVDNAVITPYIGASYTKTEYLESGLDGFNFDSTSAYMMLSAQHVNGWAYRIGVSYAMDKSDVNEEETYKEFYPYIGAMKMHNLGDNLLGIFDISGGFHQSKSDSAFNINSKDDLDNVDVTTSFAVQYLYQKFVISPRYSTTFKSYSEGSPSTNDGREDLIHSLSLKVDYPINDNMNVSLFGSYSKRDTKSTFADFDFESADGGIALGLNTSF